MTMRIVLIEDDLHLASFIKKGLGEAGFMIRHASTGIDGLDLVLNENFDLGVIDIMLPGIDGLTIIEKMREREIGFPVIILSARRSVDDRIRGLQQGGDDYVTKPFAFSELQARVQALLRRSGNIVNAKKLEFEDLEIDILAREVRRAGKKIYLQPKEYALLEFLTRNKGHVMSKSTITERVWNYNFDPNANVVEARISKLRDKVDRGFDFPIIHTVRGLGYVVKKPEC